MRALLVSVRRKVLGETWTIPLGVSATLGLALLVRALLPEGDWQLVGGFALAVLLIATLIRSLPTKYRRASKQRSAAQPHQQTTTRTTR